MKSIVSFLLAAGLIAAGCHGSDTTVKRDEQQYAVVEEGSTSGSSSTLGGSTAPPPLTATNTDTTSNFALDTATSAPGAVPPAVVAGSLPVAAPVPGLPVERAMAQGAAATASRRPTAPATGAMTSSTEKVYTRSARKSTEEPPATETLESEPAESVQNVSPVTETDDPTAPAKSSPAPQTDTGTPPTQTDTDPPPVPPPG